jgi:hypothetical protein
MDCIPPPFKVVPEKRVFTRSLSFLHEFESSPYVPLDLEADHIRLVMLHSGLFAEDVECSLLQAPIKDLGQYEALSYVWGDTRKTSSIMLAGQQLPVTENLEVALRYLRPETPAPQREIRLLWIDALCINQDYVQERNEQVLRMPRIYEAAERVVVWLGPATRESDLAMDFMHKFADEVLHNDDSLIREGAYKDEYMALAEGILLRPWWQRVWVVQEVAVARDLAMICGSRSISWPFLYRYSLFLNHFHSTVAVEVICRVNDPNVAHTSMGTVMEMARVARKKRTPMAIDQLLEYCRPFTSALPADKVYGVLGLAAGANATSLVPDYAKPASTVYAQVTKSILESSHNLDFICIGGGNKNIRELPSWVPDFSTRKASFTSALNERDTISSDILYSACGHAPLLVNFSPALNTLSATGIKFDTIRAVAPYFDCALTGIELWTALHSTLSLWFGMIAATQEYTHMYHDTEYLSSSFSTMPEAKHNMASVLQHWRAIVNCCTDHSYRGGGHSGLAFSKTITADKIRNPEGVAQRLPADQGFFDLPSGCPENFYASLHEQKRQIMWEEHLLWMVRAALKNRCFMVTQTGYIGLVSRLARAEDLVCILFGCNTPVILRAEDDHHIFIGEWYALLSFSTGIFYELINVAVMSPGSWTAS